MSDSSTSEHDESVTRMELGPDTIHEDDDGLSIDCPQCGSTVPLTYLISEGRCPNALDPDEVEVEDEPTSPQDVECSAKLGLELVWTA